jgi:hypothetical protein
MASAAEASIRARHRETVDGVVGGHAGLCRCSCGTTWTDPDMPCPRLDAELEELHHARFDDDGAPAR